MSPARQRVICSAWLAVRHCGCNAQAESRRKDSRTDSKTCSEPGGRGAIRPRSADRRPDTRMSQVRSTIGLNLERMPMAVDRKTYPKITVSSWFTLRDRAEKSPSAKITPAIVAALFDMASEGSARDNIVRPLTQLGIIDDEGGLTERGQLWRNHDTYAEACSQIVEEVYPDDLADLGDQTAVERWFSGQGLGASNARAMARTYKLLTEPSIPDDLPERKQPADSKARRPRRQKEATSSPEPPHPPTPKEPTHLAEPTLQMNLQIHLPPDATPEQIDLIFASMAKHLYNRR